MKKTILLLTLLTFATVCLAQTQFARAVGGTYTDWGESVVQTSDGGYAVVGQTHCFGAGGYDMFLVKFNSTGSLEWSRAIGGSSDDDGYSIVQTIDNGYAIVGWTCSFGAVGHDIFLVKLDSAGFLQWARTIGGEGYDLGHSVIQTIDSGYIVVGEVSSFGAGAADIFVMKFDSVGTLLWSYTIGWTGNDVGYSVIQTTDGGYAIAGETRNFSGGSILIKLNSTGLLEWCRVLSEMVGSGFNGRSSVVQTSDSGYVVAGSTYGFGAGGYDIFLAKFSSIGTMLWCRAVGGTSDDFGYSVAKTLDSGYAVGGYTWSFGPGEDNSFFVKFNSSGAVEWSRVFGGPGRDRGASVVSALDGRYVIAGRASYFGSYYYDLLLVKFDNDSCYGDYVSPTVTDISPAVTIPSPTITSPSPTVTIVTPILTVVTPTVTEIFCGELNISETIIKPQALEISAFPNPFNSACRISAPENATVEIFDLMGKSVASLEGGEQVWKPEKSVGSGIYLVRASVGEQSFTKRLVYLK